MPNKGYLAGRASLVSASRPDPRLLPVARSRAQPQPRLGRLSRHARLRFLDPGDREDLASDSDRT